MFVKLPPLRLLAATALLAALSLPTAARASVPSIVTAEGVLSTVAGTPLTDGQHALTFRLYPMSQGGVPVWQEGPVWLDVKAGHFVHELGSLVALTSDTTNQGQWVAVQVDGQAELPRSPWRSAPFALRTQVAEGLDCVGCVKPGALDPLVLAGYALAADLVGVAKVADLAVYAKSADLMAYATKVDLEPYAKSADLTATLALYVKMADLVAYAKLTDLAAYVKAADLAVTLAGYVKTGQLADYAKVADLAGYAKSADLSIYAKAADLAGYVAKPDLAAYAKLADLEPYAKVTDLAPYAKTADLSVFAKVADLAGYAAKGDLAAYAKLIDLDGYAKTSDLAAYAKTADLTVFAKVADLAGYAAKGDLAAYAKTIDLVPYAKTADLSVFAKVADLAGYAAKADLAAYAKLTDLDGYAKTGDLGAYAKTSDLTVFAKLSDLAGYAAKGDLAAYAKTSDLASYALKTDLGAYETAADLVTVLTGYAKTSDLVGYAKTGDLAAYALKTDLGTYVTASGLVAALAAYVKATDAFSGKYADLTGKPTLAQVGTACAVGQMVTGIAADGSLQCATPSGASATTLSGVSNGLLENVFDLTYPSTTTPLTIPDNNPAGVLNEIVVPDVGIVKAITVSVNVTNQDISGLVLTLFDPSNNSYVLYNKGSTGTGLVATYPTPTALVSGDLAGTWVGQNAKGTWRLIAADWKAGGTVGTLASWSISVKVLSNSQVAATASLAVNGSLTVGGKAVPQVWTAENLALAPGASLAANTGLADVPLLTSAWVMVGAEWRLVTPNSPSAGCSICGAGQDGDFLPTTDATLQGNRSYFFRKVLVPAGIKVVVVGGPLLLFASDSIQVNGTIQANGAGPGGTPAAGSPGGGGSGGGGGGGAGAAGASGSGAGGGGGGTTACGSGAGGGFGSVGGSVCGGQIPGAQYARPTAYGLLFGGSGGGGGAGSAAWSGGGGGGGGGAMILTSRTITVSSTGSLQANGGAGGYANIYMGTGGGGGGGSGGFIWIRSSALLTNGQLSVAGGLGGNGGSVGANGGAGRIAIDAGAVSGSTIPAYETSDMTGLLVPEILSSIRVPRAFRHVARAPSRTA